MKHRHLLPLLLALLLPPPALATPEAASASAMAPPVSLESASPAEGDPGAFDRLFRELDLGGLDQATTGQALEQMTQLHRLLPAGDATRELQYRYLSCRLPPEDPTAGIEAASRGLADARRLGDQHAQTRFLFCRGTLRSYVAAPQATLQDWEAGLQLARGNRDWRLVADGLIGRGHVRSLLGEHARALNDFLTAQQLYTSAGTARLAQDNVLNLGIAYRRMGENEKALSYLVRGHDEAVDRSDWNSQMVALVQQGYLLEALGQPGKAQDAYERVIELKSQRDARLDLGPARLGLASALVVQHQYAATLKVLDQAEADFASKQDTSNRDLVRLRRGQALAGLGRHQEALREFNASAEEMAASANDRYLALLLPERSRTLEALGQLGPALEDQKQFIEIQQRLLDSMAEQRSVAMRHQYDATRRELDTQRLTAETALRQKELDGLLKARRWQWSALIMGAALVLVLIALVLRQVLRGRRLGVMAMTDELTRLANRRNIELYGEETMAAARAGGRPLTVLVLDIDFFKKFNDTFGHHAGDRVLTRVAGACQGALRQIDRLGRIGGEEFLAVMPDTGSQAGTQVADRLRRYVEELDLGDIAGGMRVTISIGMAEMHPADTDFKALMDRADQALYRAKANGRNRVEVDEIPSAG